MGYSPRGFKGLNITEQQLSPHEILHLPSNEYPFSPFFLEVIFFFQDVFFKGRADPVEVSSPQLDPSSMWFSTPSSRSKVVLESQTFPPTPELG